MDSNIFQNSLMMPTTIVIPNRDSIDDEEAIVVDNLESEIIPIYADWITNGKRFDIPIKLWENHCAYSGVMKPKQQRQQARHGQTISFPISQRQLEQENLSCAPLNRQQLNELSLPISSECSTHIEMKENDDDVDNFHNDVVDYLFEHYLDELKQSMKIRTKQQQCVSYSPCDEIQNDPFTPKQIETTVDQQKRYSLLDKISQVQKEQYYADREKPNIVINGLLDCLLDVLDSEFGVIGEVKTYHDDIVGTTMYLETHAVSNDRMASSATDNFNNIRVQSSTMNSIIQGVLKTKKPVIIHHSKATTTPIDHSNPSSSSIGSTIPDSISESVSIGGIGQSFDHCLAVPLFSHGCTELNGIIVIANNRGVEYTEQDIVFLEPLAITCSNFIELYHTQDENEFLVNKLEDLVVLRTNELEMTNHQIIEAAKMQMEHFACMSHEIRTPLNCVIGLSSLLHEDDENNLTPYQKDSLSMIIRSGELLMAVVNDVLDYSKLQTEHMKMDITDTVLQETLDAVVHSMENKAADKHITIKTNYHPNVPTNIWTDSRRLQQVLYNLLGNAVKFSQDLSTVELEVSVIPSSSSSTKYNTTSHHKNTQPAGGGISKITMNTLTSNVHENLSPKTTLGLAHHSCSPFYNSVTSCRMDCSSIEDTTYTSEHYQDDVDDENDDDMNFIVNQTHRAFKCPTAMKTLATSKTTASTSSASSSSQTHISSSYREETLFPHKTAAARRQLQLQQQQHLKQLDEKLLQQQQPPLQQNISFDSSLTFSNRAVNQQHSSNRTMNCNLAAHHRSASRSMSSSFRSRRQLTADTASNTMSMTIDGETLGDESLTDSTCFSSPPTPAKKCITIVHNNICNVTMKNGTGTSVPSESIKSLDISVSNLFRKASIDDGDDDEDEDCDDNRFHESIALLKWGKPVPSTCATSVGKTLKQEIYQEQQSSVTSSDLTTSKPCCRICTDILPSNSSIGVDQLASLQNVIPTVASQNQQLNIVTANSICVDTLLSGQDGNDICNEVKDRTERRGDREDSYNSGDNFVQPKPPAFIGDTISSDTKYRLRFVVKDYGKGIAQEDFCKIFQPFQQAQTHGLKGEIGKHEGTGLGLAITSRLVSGLGGAIAVDSEVGKWTEFVVDLPLLVGEKLVTTPKTATKLYDVEDLSSMIQRLQQNKTRIMFVTNQPAISMMEEFAKKYQIQYGRYSTFQRLLDDANEFSEIDEDDYYEDGYNNMFQSRTNVFIVQEDLYDEKLYKTFVKSKPSDKTMLFTYGPKYSVKESHRHYRSMFRTIPSVIACSILNCINDDEHNNYLTHYASFRKLNHSYDNIPSPRSGSYTNRVSASVPSHMSPPETSTNITDKPNYENLRVLIAEDNVINQKVLSQMLFRLGIKHIEIVENGLEAVQASERNHFDVLLLDMEMPLMGGLEASRIIVDRYSQDANRVISDIDKSKNRKPHIAFVTAHASHEYEELAKEAGGSDFIPKPFSLQVIKNFFQSLQTKVC